MADQRIGAIRPVGQQVARGASFSHYFGKMKSNFVAMDIGPVTGSYVDVVSGAPVVSVHNPFESGPGPNGSTGSFRFNGEYSFYAKHFLPDKTLCSLKGSSQISVMVWYKHIDVNTQGSTGGSLYYESTSLPGYARIELNISITGLLSAKVRDTESGTAYTVTESEANWGKPLVGDWHLIALSYNADTEKMFLWKNGVVVGSNTSTKGPVTDTTPSDIAIGCYIPENTDYNTSVNGFISEVGLFTLALTVQDIERYVDWFKRLSNRVVGHLIPSYTFTPAAPIERLIRMPVFNQKQKYITDVPPIVGTVGLYRYWSLTEGSRVSKWGSSPYTSAIGASPKYIGGPTGKSVYHFSNTPATNYFQLDHGNSTTYPFTIMFWARMDSYYPAMVNNWIATGISSGYGGTQTSSACIVVTDAATKTIPEIIGYQWAKPYISETRWLAAVSNPPIRLKQWHHYAMVCYPLDVARGFTCIDGVRQPNNLTLSFTSWNGLGDYYMPIIGGDTGWYGATTYGLNGAVSDYALYLRRVEEWEIRSYYNAVMDARQKYVRVRYTPPPVPQRVCPIIRNSEKGYRASRMRGSMKEFIHG